MAGAMEPTGDRVARQSTRSFSADNKHSEGMGVYGPAGAVHPDLHVSDFSIPRRSANERGREGARIVVFILAAGMFIGQPGRASLSLRTGRSRSGWTTGKTSYSGRHHCTCPHSSTTERTGQKCERNATEMMTCSNSVTSGTRGSWPST